MPGLYFHIPFCVQKCHYCDFTSFPCLEIQDRYTNAILREIDLKKDVLTQQEWSTIYFGGGTPSLLSFDNFNKILNQINNYINQEKIVEFTIEVNPKTLTKEKLKFYRKKSINRLSVGVQSFNDLELKAIGRTHTANEAVKTIKMAQQAGYNNISIDLIYGLPHQTLETLIRNLRYAYFLKITHLSLYGLQVEGNTVLANLLDQGVLSLPHEQELVNMYFKSVDFLQKHGFDQYEISNFAKDDKISKHNYGYWSYDDYLSFGVSSHSKLKNYRFANTNNLTEYMEKLQGGQIPISEREYLSSKADIAFEKNMLAIRTKMGVPLREVKDHRLIKQLVEDNYAIICNGRFKLTTKGFLMSNEIINKIF